MAESNANSAQTVELSGLHFQKINLLAYKFQKLI